MVRGQQTFMVSPIIFIRLFTIIGLRWRDHLDSKDTPLLPFVYTLLEGAHAKEYERVLNSVKDAVARYNVNAIMKAYENTLPQR